MNEVLNILALEELLALPVEQAHEAMLDLSKKVSDQVLSETWAIQFNWVRKLRLILGIRKDHSGAVVFVDEIHKDSWPPVIRSRKPWGRKGKVSHAADSAFVVTDEAQCPSKCLSLSINGTFTGAELEPRIEMVRSLVKIFAESKYAINLSLEEVAPKQVIFRNGAGSDRL